MAPALLSCLNELPERGEGTPYVLQTQEMHFLMTTLAPNKSVKYLNVIFLFVCFHFVPKHTLTERWLHSLVYLSTVMTGLLSSIHPLHPNSVGGDQQRAT